MEPASTGLALPKMNPRILWKCKAWYTAGGGGNGQVVVVVASRMVRLPAQVNTLLLSCEWMSQVLTEDTPEF